MKHFLINVVYFMMIFGLVLMGCSNPASPSNKIHVGDETSGSGSGTDVDNPFTPEVIKELLNGQTLRFGTAFASKVHTELFQIWVDSDDPDNGEWRVVPKGTAGAKFEPSPEGSEVDWVVVFPGTKDAEFKALSEAEGGKFLVVSESTPGSIFVPTGDNWVKTDTWINGVTRFTPKSIAEGGKFLVVPEGTEGAEFVKTGEEWARVAAGTEGARFTALSFAEGGEYLVVPEGTEGAEFVKTGEEWVRVAAGTEGSRFTALSFAEGGEYLVVPEGTEGAEFFPGEPDIGYPIATGNIVAKTVTRSTGAIDKRAANPVTVDFTDDDGNLIYSVMLTMNNGKNEVTPTYIPPTGTANIHSSPVFKTGNSATNITSIILLKDNLYKIGGSNFFELTLDISHYVPEMAWGEYKICGIWEEKVADTGYYRICGIWEEKVADTGHYRICGIWEEKVADTGHYRICGIWEEKVADTGYFQACGIYEKKIGETGDYWAWGIYRKLMSGEYLKWMKLIDNPGGVSYSDTLKEVDFTFRDVSAGKMIISDDTEGTLTVSFRFAEGFAEIIDSINCVIWDDDDIPDNAYFPVEDHTISFDYAAGDEVYVGVSLEF